MFRILVTDDDILQLDLRKQLLEIAGYRVDAAFTASQTLNEIQKHSPDLVILDLRLPNDEGNADPREGLALIRRIRETGCSTPLLVLSGWPEDIYGQAEEQMVSHVLLKPVRTRELIHTIASLLT